MSGLRSRLLGILLLCTALAVGIALGAGPLSDLGSRAPEAGAAPAPTPPPADPEAAFSKALVARAAATLYAGGLDRRPVVILTLPGADPAQVSSLTDQVRQAGGTVTATYALKQTLLDTGEKTLVDTLGEQLVAQGKAGLVTEGATTYDRMGQLIGRAVATTRGSGALTRGIDEGVVDSLRASLRGARLLSAPAVAGAEDAGDAGDAPAPGNAPLVLVVSGSAPVDPVVLTGLAAGLAATAKGVVVAGPTGADALLTLRATLPERPVTTVDGTESGTGQVVAVLGLLHAWQTPGGSFGATGADGAAPLE